MKRISWITAECYLDVDLPIIARLKERFKIYWQIVLNHDSKINNETYVRSLIEANAENINIQFVEQKYRQRTLRALVNYYKVINRAKAFKPDLFYVSNYQMPWGILLYQLMLPLKKVVVPCHNVTTPKGASAAGFTSKYTALWLKTFKNIQVFSRSQYKVLTSMHQDKNILLAPLAIKDYGEPTKTVQKSDEVITFLNFGIIQPYKRVDLLIKAANTLVDRGYKNFKVKIAGSCKAWNEYASMIKYPEVFDLNIARIPNEDVANLFAESHYFVMPYQDIAQSGAITVAFRYNLPTLVSDIEPFKEFVEDGITGLTFKSEDYLALADKMQYLIDNHKKLYPALCKAQAEYVGKELSLPSIVAKYRQYFENL